MAELVGRNNFLLSKLLKRINSSCSSGRERRKSVRWHEWTINAAARQGNLEMVKYCVANECPIEYVGVCICCPKRSSRGTQILTRRSESALGLVTASWAAENGHLHILEYLVERKYDQYSTKCVSVCGQNGHLDCLKYLRETAKAPWDYGPYETRTEKPHRMCTIPPRQQLSSPTRLAIRRWNVTHVVNTCTDTQRERERETN